MQGLPTEREGTLAMGAFCHPFTEYNYEEIGSFRLLPFSFSPLSHPSSDVIRLLHNKEGDMQLAETWHTKIQAPASLVPDLEENVK